MTLELLGEGLAFICQCVTMCVFVLHADAGILLRIFIVYMLHHGFTMIIGHVFGAATVMKLKCTRCLAS